MNLNDISFDCASLGVDTDAPIISIGAVAFDRTTGKLGQTFHKEIGIDSAIKAGRVRADTLRWWINQSPQARVLLSKPDSEKPSLATVLLEFTTWARGVGKGVPRVWAKGPAEDVAWLRTALRNGSHGLSEPWGYNNVRDVRTIIELAAELAGFEQNSVGDVGVAHNALDDAIYQANCVSAAYAALRTVGAMSNAFDRGTKTRSVNMVKAAATDDEL